MNNIDKFRDLYLQLETITLDNHQRYDGESFYNVLSRLKDDKIYPYFSEYEFIDFCRRYRNNISHQELDNKYLDFSDDFIEKLSHIVDYIKYPISAYEFSTKNILSANIDDNVLEFVNIMLNKGYNYAPIYDKDRLVGIFSERSLFSYLNKNHKFNIDADTKFIDILDYIDINHLNERIYFANKNTRLTEMIKLFADEDNKKRISCVFITLHGHKNEKVIGILTTHDVISSYGKL